MNTEKKTTSKQSNFSKGVYTVFGKPIEGMSGIPRFSRRLKVREENVAEHSWYVSYMTLVLCEQHNLDDYTTRLALKYAICHDLPELVLDDVNHDVKRSYPVIKRELAREEDKLFSELGDDILFVHSVDRYQKPYREHLVAKAVVDLADTHSVAMYVQSELNMGNSYFDWIGEINARIRDLEVRLEEALEYVG